MNGPTIDTFLTYEQAKQVKELGYDEQAYFFYSLNFADDGTPVVVHRGFVMPYRNTEMDTLELSKISAPTQAQATRWLRSKGYETVVTPVFDYEEGLEGYDFGVYDDTTGYIAIQGTFPYSETYEEALSKAIDAALDLMKGGQE